MAWSSATLFNLQPRTDRSQLIDLLTSARGAIKVFCEVA